LDKPGRNRLPAATLICVSDLKAASNRLCTIVIVFFSGETLRKTTHQMNIYIYQAMPADGYAWGGFSSRMAH
jgi:CO dehydrogenase/acetyl-CoA synthase alpha subunit